MTVNDIFSITVDLISERLDSGAIDTTNVVNYQKRTPGLLTLLQTEIARISPLYKTVAITATGTTDSYIAISMPADFAMLYQLLDTNLEPIDDFKRVGNDIYVLDSFTGTMVYKYIPASITALTDTIVFDDIIAKTVLPYGLAGSLLANENVNLSNYFNSKYEELKGQIKMQEPAPSGKSVDYYDSKLTY